MFKFLSFALLVVSPLYTHCLPANEHDYSDIFEHDEAGANIVSTPISNVIQKTSGDQEKICTLDTDGNLGVCVPFHLCTVEGVIDYFGENSINIRSTFEECSYIERCCGRDAIKTTPEIDIPAQHGSQGDIPNTGGVDYIPGQNSGGIPNTGGVDYIPGQNSGGIPNTGGQFPETSLGVIPDTGNEGFIPDASQGGIPNTGGVDYIPGQNSGGIPNTGSEGGFNPGTIGEGQGSGVPNVFQGVEKSPDLDSQSQTHDIHLQCGIRNLNGVGFHITGNTNGEAQFGEFPYMLALLKREYLLDSRVSADESMKIYQCGATLIAPNVALTAAHCVKDVDLETLLVRAGEWDTQTPHEIFKHQDYDISEVITHERFHARNLHNDIALLILSQPVKLAEHINTVCLPHHMEFTKESECYAMGWGKDKFGKEGEYQVILKRVQLPIVPHGECQDRLRTSRLSRYFKLHESFMCAGGEVGKDVCTGDGGGPLVCKDFSTNRYYQAGIIAWGIGCNNEYPGVYVNVGMFRNWIDEVLAQRGIQPVSYTL